MVRCVGSPGDQSGPGHPARCDRSPGQRMTTLAWYPANSADADHDDLEADLCPLGCPGGAVWAWVADEGSGWSWSVYARWLWEDIDADPDRHTLAESTAGSQEQAKAAVAEWV